MSSSVVRSSNLEEISPLPTRVIASNFIAALIERLERDQRLKGGVVIEVDTGFDTATGVAACLKAIKRGRKFGRSRCWSWNYQMIT